MSLRPASSRHAVLSVLKDAPLERKQALEVARYLAGSDAGGALALHRLQQGGLIVCEYRVTKEGAAALRKVERRKKRPAGAAALRRANQ